MKNTEFKESNSIQPPDHITFPNLRLLMTKYNISRQNIADLIGKSYRQTTKKLNKEVVFDLDEAQKVTEFFKNQGENVTVDNIFLGIPFSIETNKPKRT